MRFCEIRASQSGFTEHEFFFKIGFLGFALARIWLLLPFFFPGNDRSVFGRHRYLSRNLQHSRERVDHRQFPNISKLSLGFFYLDRMIFNVIYSTISNPGHSNLFAIFLFFPPQIQRQLIENPKRTSLTVSKNLIW